MFSFLKMRARCEVAPCTTWHVEQWQQMLASGSALHLNWTAWQWHEPLNLPSNESGSLLYGITFGKSSSVWFLSACSCAPPMVAGLFGASWSSGFGFFAAGGDEGGSREGARVGRQRERSQLASERGREADAKMCGA